MGIEYTPQAKRKAQLKRARRNHMPKASPVTITKADGSVTIQPALVGSVNQVPKR